jgi:hypothetical protein
VLRAPRGTPELPDPPGATGAQGPVGTGGLTTLDLELDELTGTTFADSSGYGSVATAPVGGIAAGASGHTHRAIAFSGGVITISGPTNIPYSPQIWVEAWIQPQAPLNATRTILTRESCPGWTRRRAAR